MNILRRSYSHRKNLRLLELSLDPTKILRGSYDVLTTFVRPNYEERVSYDVKKNLGHDHRPRCELTNGLRTVCERWFRTAFLRRSYEMV